MCEVLHNFVFIVQQWASTSHFQRHFWYVVCFINICQIQSQLVVHEFQKQLYAIYSIRSENIGSELEKNKVDCNIIGRARLNEQKGNWVDEQKSNY